LSIDKLKSKQQKQARKKDNTYKYGSEKKKPFANGNDVVEGLFSLMSLRAKYICIFSKDILSK
jgi:hypothetical protein